jgi:hypothetical protein
MRLLACLFSLTLLPLLPTYAQSSAPTDVLKVARAFKDGGSYDEKWHGSGVPEEINFKGEKILRTGEGTYCCGYTFAVAMRAATARGLLKDKTPQQIREFQKEWYGATEASKEIECAFAVKKLGIGKAVSMDEAKAGDFVQLWRGKSGHSVIFLKWAEKNGQKIGFHYRSSQPRTKGIGDAVEYFQGNGSKPGEVLKERTYFCRLNEK